MSKVLVDRELLLFLNGEAELEGLAFGEHQPGKPFWWRKHLREAIARPAEAEGAKDYLTEFAEGEVEAKTAITELQDALSAVTAERDRLHSTVEDLAMALDDAEDRAESAGRNASAFEDRMGDLQVENGKLRDARDQLRAEAEALRKDVDRWRYVSLQGDDTHWLNLLRVDLEDFGGNVNAAVDVLIDGEAPAMAAKEA